MKKTAKAHAPGSLLSNIRIIAGLFTLVVLTCCIAAAPPTHAASDKMIITAIDLGAANTGEATMITDGNGKALLVDSGDRHNDTVFDWLSSNGYNKKKFDTLVTHWHDDHAGNTAEIIRRYHVRTVYLPTTAYLNNVDNRAYRNYELSYARDILRAAKERGTKVVYLKKGMKIKVGTVTGKVLYFNGSPKSESWYGVQYINNQSSVIMFSGGGSKYLTCGDIHKEAEKRILKSGADIHADIFKMSHHGYATSNSQKFIEAVKPTYAYFTSCHSSPNNYKEEEVRDCADRMGLIANTFGTRYNGTLRFTCSGGTIKVKAQRNTAKMYQKLIDKKTGEVRRVSFVFNDACTTRMTDKILDSDKYYNRQINKDGSVFSGKRVKAGDSYYLKKGNIRAHNTFAKCNGKIYYYSYSDRRMSGFIRAYGRTYYMSPSRVTGFKTIDGNKYYFMDKRHPKYSSVKEGMMVSGFFTIEGKKYYGANSKLKGYSSKIRGVICKGWNTISNKEYYFDKTGVMQTGWKKIGSDYYYFASNGVMQTGVLRDGGKIYHLDQNGRRVTGWHKMLVSGSKVKITRKADCLDQSGKATEAWDKAQGDIYYANAGGEIMTGQQTIDGAAYTFDKNGVLISPEDGSGQEAGEQEGQAAQDPGSQAAETAPEDGQNAEEADNTAQDDPESGPTSEEQDDVTEDDPGSGSTAEDPNSHAQETEPESDTTADEQEGDPGDGTESGSTSEDPAEDSSGSGSAENAESVSEENGSASGEGTEPAA